MIQTVLPQAAEEVAATAIWYEKQRSGLGDSFLAEWHAALNLVCKAPFSHPFLEYEVGSIKARRCRLKRFPYALIYEPRTDEILIFALAHGSRHPLYWVDRIPSD